MAAFSAGMPQDQSTDTGVVGRYEAAKELQRAKLAGFASGVPVNDLAPMNAGANAALTPPPAPMMGAAPQMPVSPPMPPQGPAPTPMSTGRIVTKPTTAVLAEEPGSVEMVVPMNHHPDNKTSIAALSPMSRYQRR